MDPLPPPPFPGEVPSPSHPGKQGIHVVFRPYFVMNRLPY